MKRIITLLTLILLFTITSCEIDSPTSGYQVFFTCDFSFYPFEQINSPGLFITIRPKNNGKSYEVTDANGEKNTHHLTASELHTPYYYGLGGLIIGTPYSDPNNIWVYDLACPACENARYNKLDLNRDDGTGHATCPNCGIVYDLNNEGIPIKGKSRPLWRYNYFTSGTTIVIRN